MSIDGTLALGAKEMVALLKWPQRYDKLIAI